MRSVRPHIKFKFKFKLSLATTRVKALEWDFYIFAFHIHWACRLSITGCVLCRSHGVNPAVCEVIAII